MLRSWLSPRSFVGTATKRSILNRPVLGTVTGYKNLSFSTTKNVTERKHNNNNTSHTNTNTNGLVTTEEFRNKRKSLRSFDRFVNKKKTITDLTNQDDQNAGPYRCTGISLGESIDTKALFSSFSKSYRINRYQDHDFLHIQYTQQNLTEPISVTEKSTEPVNMPDEEEETFYLSPTKNIFIFKEGAIVCWGMNHAEEASWAEDISRFAHVRVARLYEQMNFFFGDSTTIEADTIILDKASKPKDSREEMLAYSAGIVRSLQLELLEDENEKFADHLDMIPDQLVADKLPKRKAWSIITGDQMKLRSKLSLNSTLLDFPDLFWEHHKMCTLFKEMRENLDLDQRIDTLDKRLDIIERIMSTVQSMINEKSSHRLEMIIILLIATEVLFYLLDKSVYWRNFTIEGLLNKDFVPPPGDSGGHRMH